MLFLGCGIGVGIVLAALLLKKSGNKPSPKSAEIRDNKKAAKESLYELYRICRDKGMLKYAKNVDAQMTKMDKRIETLTKALIDNLGKDSNDGEIMDIMARYQAIFYDNVDKITKRVDLMQPQTQNGVVTMDNSLRMKSKQILEEHTKFVEEKLSMNEKILMQLDELTAEITHLNDSADEEMESLQDYISALKNLNEGTAEEIELKMLMQKY